MADPSSLTIPKSRSFGGPCQCACKLTDSTASRQALNPAYRNSVSVRKRHLFTFASVFLQHLILPETGLHRCSFMLHPKPGMSPLAEIDGDFGNELHMPQPAILVQTSRPSAPNPPFAATCFEAALAGQSALSPGLRECQLIKSSSPFSMFKEIRKSQTIRARFSTTTKSP